MMIAVELPTAIGVVAGLLGISAAVGAALVVVLRSTKNEIIADQDKRITQLKEERDDERARCAADVARLEGERDVLKGQVVKDIAAEVAAKVEDILSRRGGGSRG